MKIRVLRAFTLVELLVVIAIASILLALSTMGYNSVMRSSGLTHGTQDLVNELGLARQLALTKNCAIEVRFYRCQNEMTGSNSYRSFQLFAYTDAGTASQVSKEKWLSHGVILDSSTTLSSLLAPSQTKAWNSLTDPQPALPKVGLNYTAKVFRFRPDGSTDLSISSQWFLTLHSFTEGDARSSLPVNYATIKLDPVNGQVRTYRP